MIYDIKTIKEIILKAAFDDACSPQDCAALWKTLCIEKRILFFDQNYPMIVRCSYNRNGEVFKHVGRLSYNPFIDTVSLQRCNFQRQPVFYGATGLDNENVSIMATAIIEVCLEYIKQSDMDTHYMTLSRWRLSKKMPVFVIPYSPSSSLKNPEFKKTREHFDTKIIELAKELNVTAEYITEFLEFISNIFCMKDNKSNYYKVSSAYVNYIMNFAASIGHGVDGLLYPSANTEFAGINIALHTGIIDDKTIYADMALMFKARRRPNNPKHFDIFCCSNEAIIGPDGKFVFSSIW